MEFDVLGGSWLSAAGYGMLGDNKEIRFAYGPPELPQFDNLFPSPLKRSGRFDDFAKIGITAIALSIKDAGLYCADTKQNIGIISSSLYECLETDFTYYETTFENDGAFASANRFAYTLHGALLAEAAICFGFKGPIFCVAENGSLGLIAMTTAIEILQAGEADATLAGWIENYHKGIPEGDTENPLHASIFRAADRSFRNRMTDKRNELCIRKEGKLPCGAVFVVLGKHETARNARKTVSCQFTGRGLQTISCNGVRISSILDIF